MKLFTPLSLCLFIAIYTVMSISFAVQNDPEIYEAQIALTKLGYNSGIPDGIWGELTESALIKFQRDSELLVTGQLDDQTKKKCNRSQDWLVNSYVNQAKSGFRHLKYDEMALASIGKVA
jgi:peptidoglycan hydrolase-like protein with peptidoglycan-binding domain